LKPDPPRNTSRERAGFARPQGRARIETGGRLDKHGRHRHASPGLKAGRGLKRRLRPAGAPRPRASPGLKAGRGLKLVTLWVWVAGSQASPGLKAGRGLKLGGNLGL